MHTLHPDSVVLRPNMIFQISLQSLRLRYTTLTLRGSEIYSQGESHDEVRTHLKQKSKHDASVISTNRLRNRSGQKESGQDHRGRFMIQVLVRWSTDIEGSGSPDQPARSQDTVED